MLNEMTIQQEPRRLAPTGSIPLEMERPLLTLEKLSKANKWAYLKGSPNNLPYFVYRYEGHEISEKFLSDYLVDSYFWLNSVA